jgi:murein L,D-transpeptidase YafK
MMSFNQKNRIVSLTVLAAIGVIAVALVPTHMQDMTKGKSELEAEQTIKLPAMREPRIIIKKRHRTLEVFDGDKLVKTYTVVLGFAPEGDKEIEGDGKTPEGEFYIFTKNSQSKFHLSLGLSYPSVDDAKRGSAKRLVTRSEHDAIVTAIEKKKMPPQKTALGGEIYIHGGGLGSDWTWGCVALRNEEVEEIFNAVRVGTPVSIRP